MYGGVRRDEEKARAKELFFSHRRLQRRTQNQRPELWDLYNSKHQPGEYFRVFPLNNWTELDIWNYILGRTSPSRTSTPPTSARGPPQRPNPGPQRIPQPAAGREAGDPAGPLPDLENLTITGAVEAMPIPRVAGVAAAHKTERVAEWTTSAASRPWRTARRKGISEDERRNRHGTGPSAHQSRRRQEHVDRPPAYHNQGIFEDQQSIEQAPQQGTDGLTARRTACAPSGAGITIDVACNYFATRRKFIVADDLAHPVHPEHGTGASTADLAIILVDARAELLEQTQQAIAHLLGIKPWWSRQQNGSRRLESGAVR